MSYECNNRMRTTVQPYAEPFNILEAKSFLDVTPSDTSRDGVINSLIRDARNAAEEITRRYLVAQTVTVTLDRFGGGYSGIELPTPLISADSVVYIDIDGNTQTWDAANYEIDDISEPAMIWPAVLAQVYWPQVSWGTNPITITTKAGYLTPFTVNASTNLITALGRTFTAADRVRLSNSGGKLPAGLATYTDYYVRDVSGSSFKLEASVGGGAIDITDIGTGTSFIGEVPERIREAMMLRMATRFEYPEGGEMHDKGIEASNLMLFEAAVPTLVAS